MTTLIGRPNSALLVIDLQHDVVAHAFAREAVLATVADLVARARAAQVPVVWVRHADAGLLAGSDGWRIVTELVPGAAEAIIEKGYRDAFEDTGLEQVLAQAQVGRLIVTGAQTDFCIRSTLHGALARGYDAVLVGDAHTTETLAAPGAPAAEAVIRHTNLYWANQHAPGRRGSVLHSDEVVFGA
jgi:nicotinamidase-related amidase